MKLFVYKSKDEFGKVFHGMVEAQDKKDIKAKVKKIEGFFIDAYVCNEKELFKLKVNMNQLLLFTSRFYSLIEAGVPILSVMSILWRQTESKDMQLIISYIRNRLEKGASLSEATACFPRTFPFMYRALLSVAESGAGLEIILKKLSEYLEKQKKFVERVQGAMVYPTIVLSFAGVVIVLLFVFVVPTFIGVLEKLQVEIPAVTQLVINISAFFRSFYFPLIVGTTVAVIYFGRKKLESDYAFAVLFDSIKFKIPVLGRVAYLMCISRFLHSLSLLVAAGVPVLKSFEIARPATGNKKIERDLRQVERQVIGGGSLYVSFKKAKAFPVLLVEMVGVGETTGTLGASLGKVAVHFDEELDAQLTKMLGLLEPILIIGVGGVVGLVLMSIYLPIFQLWQGI